MSGDRHYEAVYISAEFDDACEICTIAGRPCGGRAATCGAIRCSACQDTTWFLSKAKWREHMRREGQRETNRRGARSAREVLRATRGVEL